MQRDGPYHPLLSLVFIPSSYFLRAHSDQITFRVTPGWISLRIAEWVEASSFPVIFLLYVCTCRKRQASREYVCFMSRHKIPQQPLLTNFITSMIPFTFDIFHIPRLQFVFTRHGSFHCPRPPGLFLCGQFTSSQWLGRVKGIFTILHFCRRKEF
ncbi:hypothetical protein BDW72DRAFT_92012 [Aspergillus terricola var. indicus]